MKTAFKYFFTLGIVLTLSLEAVNAQSTPLNTLSFNEASYKTAVGVRVGETTAVTFKNHFRPSTALELQLGFWNHGFSTTFLIEKHVPAFNEPGLQWYYGAGAHASFYNHYHWAKHYENGRRYYTTDEVGIGIDGVIGIEYKIPQIPFAFSLDFVPYVEVISNGDVWASVNPGFGIKLCF